MFVHSEEQRRLSNRTSLLRPNRTVQIRLQFLNFGTINTVNEVYRATILMKARWTEARRINIYDPDMDWNPRLYIENGQTISTVNWVEETRYELRHFDEYTEITEIKSITGDFWERMELHDFPLGFNFFLVCVNFDLICLIMAIISLLDTQELGIIICSYYGPKYVKIVADSEKISTIHPRAFHSFHEQQKYMLHSMVKVDTIASYEIDTEYKHIASKTSSDCLSISVTLTRKANFFILNNFSTVFIITLLSLTLFSATPLNVSNRLSAVFTLLLTLFAFKIVTSTHLPTISYLTLIDKYQVMSIVFLSVLSVWFSLLVSIGFTEDEIRRIDRISFLVFIGIFIAMNVSIIVMLLISVRKINNLQRQDEEFRAMLKSICHYDTTVFDY